jgi:DnaJ family protein C protein 28
MTRLYHRQLEQLRSVLDQHDAPSEKSDQPDRPRSDEERRALVEQRIQEAMASGAFDNLPGKGKPLDLNQNPYLEPGQALAFGLLKNNGFAPEWIERAKEIRQELDAARAELRSAWRQHQSNPASDAFWQATVARFEATLAKLNRKIDDFNLIAPIVSSQRPRLRLADELRRAQEEKEA